MVGWFGPNHPNWDDFTSVVGMIGARETSRREVRAPGTRRPARSAGENVGSSDKMDSSVGAARRLTFWPALRAGRRAPGTRTARREVSPARIIPTSH